MTSRRLVGWWDLIGTLGRCQRYYRACSSAPHLLRRMLYAMHWWRQQSPMRAPAGFSRFHFHIIAVLPDLTNKTNEWMKSVTTSGFDVNSYERKRFCLKDLNLPVHCSTIGPMFLLMYICTPSTMDEFMFLVFLSLLLFFLYRDRSHAFSRGLFPDWPIAEVTV